MTDTLRARGELALLEEIRRLVPRRRRVVLGPGDDAAVIARSRHPQLLTIDTLIENVHFRRRWLSPRALGARAFEVSASDVAAMGGRAVAALLAIAAPPTTRAAELRAMVLGVRAAAERAGAALAGGNLAAADALSLTVAIVGEAPAPPVTRSGGRVGDQLFVTGTVGGAALGLHGLRTARSMLVDGGAVRRWQRPTARLRAGVELARRRIAAAMIDVSDGLLIDAERLARASGVGIVLRWDRLPLAPGLSRLGSARARALALGGGEDYELLFAVRPARLRGLAARPPCARVPDHPHRPARRRSRRSRRRPRRSSRAAAAACRAPALRATIMTVTIAEWVVLVELAAALAVWTALALAEATLAEARTIARTSEGARRLGPLFYELHSHPRRLVISLAVGRELALVTAAVVSAAAGYGRFGLPGGAAAVAATAILLLVLRGAAAGAASRRVASGQVLVGPALTWLLAPLGTLAAVEKSIGRRIAHAFLGEAPSGENIFAPDELAALEEDGGEIADAERALVQKAVSFGRASRAPRAHAATRHRLGAGGHRARGIDGGDPHLGLLTDPGVSRRA